ncbi:MAG: PAS domain S-box protein [SAR324 cluster bacterium]|nr:PAS domain S-box protein [SAR324 cluster bacterium]
MTKATPPVSGAFQSDLALPDFAENAHLASLPPLGDQDLLHLPWFNTIMEMMKEAVITVNCEGEITYMNAAAELLTLQKKKDALCRNSTAVFTLLDAEKRTLVRSPAMKSILKKSLVQLGGSTILVRSDGSHVFVEGSAFPIRIGTGETVGATLMFRDITEHKNARAMIQRLLTLVFRHSQMYFGLIKRIIDGF